MSTKIRKLTCLLLAVIMLFATIPVMTASAKTVDSGKCGDNVKWSLDSNGTLTISGKGKMDDYEGYTDQPWFKYAGDSQSTKIEKIVVKDGVTHVGKNAFYGMVYYYIKSLKLADSVTSLGDYAFFECRGLTDVDLGTD